MSYHTGRGPGVCDNINKCCKWEGGGLKPTKYVLHIIRMTTYCQPSLYLKLTQNDVENLKLRQRIPIWPGRSGRRKLFDCAFQTNFVKKFDLFKNI
jgi:hypothetical protein